MYKWILLLLPVLASCKSSDKRQWENKRISFPENLVFTKAGTDTIPFDFSKSKWKFFIYADTTDCMGCKLYLDRWNTLIAKVKADESLNNLVSFTFFLFPNNVDEMKFIIDCDLPDYPVCIDTDNRIGRLNDFSTDEYFLLDEHNQIVLVGNPVSDPQIEKSYWNKIIDEPTQ